MVHVLCVWYVHMCVCRYMLPCMCGDQRTSGVLLYWAPTFSLEAGFLTVPKARLVASKPP